MPRVDKPRADKGRNRVAWVDVPCSCGCGKRVRRQRSQLKSHMFATRQCYHRWLKGALVRLAEYERRYGPLDHPPSGGD